MNAARDASLVGDDALDAFVAKWLAAHPECELALRFEKAPRRRAQAAFGALTFELELLAFGQREPHVAAAKLGWWNEELERARRGEPRHPITQALAGDEGEPVTQVLGARSASGEIPIVARRASALASVSTAAIANVVGAAARQRDAESASDHAALIARYLDFYTSVAAIEANLFGNVDIAATATTLAVARALRDTLALAHAESSSLPLPLDLLARHGLARGALSERSTARDAAAGEHFARLAATLDAARSGVALTRFATADADGRRARAASRAADPLGAFARSAARVPFGTVFAVWRAARRAR